MAVSEHLEAPVADAHEQRRWPLPGSRRRWSVVVEVAVLLLLPPVVLAVYQVEPFFLQNGIDPFLYIGYQQNMDDLVARFGFPYYAVRFGLILPGQATSALFGIVGGYFVLRYLLAVLAAGAVYLLSRRWGSRATGWLGVVVCLTSPVFLRALMTTYSDTIVVPCLLAGLAALLLPSRHPRWWALAAGLAFGVAIHANPVFTLLLVVVLGARLVLQVVRREWHAFADLAVAVAGVLAVTAAGVIYYAVRFDRANIFRPSIEASRALTGEATAPFRSPDLDWLNYSPHLYLPVLALALAIGVLLTRPHGEGSRWRSWLAAPLADVIVLLVAAVAFFLQQQFLGNRYLLETYYYASYLFPFFLLALIAAMVELRGRPGVGERVAWLAAGVAALLPLARNLWFDGLQLWAWPTVPLLLVLVVIVLVAARWWRPGLAVAAILTVSGVVLLGLAPPLDLPAPKGQFVRQDPRYHLAMGNPSTRGLDVLSLADQLIDMMPREGQAPGSVVFWYPRSGLIDTVEATYLWRASALQLWGEAMPTLNDQQRQMLLERTPRHLVLLAETPEQIAKGREAVEALGLEPLEVHDSVLHSGDLTIYVQRLVLDPSSCDGPWSHDSAFVPGWLGLGPCPAPSGS